MRVRKRPRNAVPGETDDGMLSEGGSCPNLKDRARNDGARARLRTGVQRKVHVGVDSPRGRNSCNHSDVRYFAVEQGEGCVSEFPNTFDTAVQHRSCHQVAAEGTASDLDRGIPP